MMTDPDILTVSALTAHLKYLLEDSFPSVWVTGEVSNFKKHPTSGHMYFSLKDDRSQLKCVMWRSQNQALAFIPQDGMQVIAQGSLTVYEASGQYQLVVRRLQPSGEGALQAAFEQLKARLAEEGLFDPERKRPLPPFPERIGVVTSASGAAVRDIIRILHRRAPWVDIVLRPVRVQGEGAAADIATAIREMNAFGAVDVLIVGRGGGSIEDLWAFNEEAVVRAIVESGLPVISAVGHEIDVTLADFAADVRAPTPSGAAELVVRDRVDLLDRVGTGVRRVYGAMDSLLTHLRQRVDTLVSSYGLRHPMDLIGQHAQRVDELGRMLLVHREHQIQHRKHVVGGLIGRLNALNPLAVLERGYAVCRTIPDGAIIRDAATLAPGHRIDVTLHHGHATCRVERVNGAPSTSTRKTAQSREERLSLFDD